MRFSMSFLLLFNVFSAFLLVGSVTPAMSLEADPAPEGDRLEAARELVRVLFKPREDAPKPREEAPKTPAVPRKAGDRKFDERLFLDLARRSQEWGKELGQAPLTDEAIERRTDITARYLAQRLSTIELRKITEYVRTDIDQKVEDILLLSAGASLIKCGLDPSFNLELDENIDSEKLSVARKIVADLNLTASTLALEACQSFIAENKLARELTIEELNTALAFGTSETGRKYREISVNRDR
jgi:hypothetical protein